MKTDEIKQKYIADKTYYRYGRYNWNPPLASRIYELNGLEQDRFEIMRQYELAGFVPSQLTPLGKIRLRYKHDGATYGTNDPNFKRFVLENTLEIFPDFFEIRFLSGGIYIR